MQKNALPKIIHQSKWKNSLHLREEDLSMSERRPMAFMSYVHFADEHDKRYLTRFCQLLSGEVQLLSGEEFFIFQDRNDIEWGESWKERIEDSIDNISFLIAIITPGFFKSDNCRDELKRFLEREKKLGRKDLVLPIYYVTTPRLEDKSLRDEDNLAEIIYSHQYADWRDLRFKDLDSKLAKKTINKMADQICKALNRIHPVDQISMQKNIELSDRLKKTYVNCINALSKIEQQEPISINEEDYGQAMNLLKDLLNIYPDSNSLEYQDLYERIMNLFKEGFGDGDAGELKSDLIRIASGQDPAVYWFNKGKDLYNITKKFDRVRSQKCIDYFRKAAEEDQNYAEAWHYKGLALTKYGDNIRKTQRNEADKLWIEAVEAFDKARNLDVENIEICIDKSYALNRLRRYYESIKVCDEIIRDNSTSLRAKINRAYALLGKAQSTEDFLAAAKAYDAVLKLSENRIDAHYCKGIALIKAGKYEKAIKELDEAITINRNYEDAWNKKGEVLKALGRTAEADAALVNASIARDNIAKFKEAGTPS
jgi:tetratricopeptide (TPR) repeat protein